MAARPRYGRRFRCRRAVPLARLERDRCRAQLRDEPRRGAPAGDLLLEGPAVNAARTVLIAPDSFKGSLTSVSVAYALGDGWRRARPHDTVLLSPLADGGEGTLVAVEAA